MAAVGGDRHEDGGRHARYTVEQVEVLERAYVECPKPSSLRRQQLIRECPILSNIKSRQIKVWFQNRRRREKHRKDAVQLQSVTKKLNAVNELLMEENDRLQKQVSQLVYENGHMQQKLQNVLPAATTDTGFVSVVSTQHSSWATKDSASLLLIAEETMEEFLSKATGTAVNWVQIPRMKPGLDSVGIISISHSCNGVAARACGLVNLEPAKIVEIIKDRPSWFRDCRNQEVFAKFPARNAGTIELIYMQIFAPTTLAPAHDFWTLRYTSILEDGSLVVCEKSMSGSGAGPNPSSASQFARAKMLASGYLIRPCKGGGSIVHIVDHLDLEAWSVPEVLRPLYESSKLVAQKMTVAALHHIRQIAQETSSEVTHGSGKQPAVLQAFRQRLSRGFNDAINGFNDDGWSLMNCDAAEDLIISVKSTKNLGTISDFSLPRGILSVKASMLLQNVSPALLVQFLREHRSEWADSSIDAYSAASLKSASFPLVRLSPTEFSGSQNSMPLDHTVKNEILEVIQLQGRFSQEELVLFRNIHLLQICNGIEENAIGACSELVFAPIDEMLSDDALLLSSGFRILPLDSKTCARYETSSAQQLLDPASHLNVRSATSHTAGCTSSSNDSRSVLIIAFQFPFEGNLQENLVTMARLYFCNVISCVQRVTMAITPPGLSPQVEQTLTPHSPGSLALARWICQSYSIHLGAELLRSNCQGGDSVLKQLWHHQDAILCCSLKVSPVCIFANQAGLDMLETTLVALQDITLGKIFDESGRKALSSVVPQIMRQGFAFIPSGFSMSTMGRHVSYNQVIAWKVLNIDSTVHCLAFAFINWSFV